MSAGSLWQIAFTFGVLSVLSVGGANATLPEIHRQVVDLLHWMDDATFASLVAIAQSAPGPNVLTVSMMGWYRAGVAGLVVATLAILTPSCVLAVIVERATIRFAAVSWVALTRAALAPIAVGLMLASGYVMTRAAYKGPMSIALVAGGAALIVMTTRSPFLAVAVGALAGLCGHRLHFFG
jgi:chromate transporter